MRIKHIGNYHRWCYNVFSDAPDRRAIHSFVACGGCYGGCVPLMTPFQISPGESSQICINPRDLKPKVAVGIRLTVGEKETGVYFGFSELPKEVQSRLAKLDLKPCQASGDPPTLELLQQFYRLLPELPRLELTVPKSFILPPPTIKAPIPEK